MHSRKSSISPEFIKIIQKDDVHKFKKFLFRCSNNDIYLMLKWKAFKCLKYLKRKDPYIHFEYHNSYQFSRKAKLFIQDFLSNSSYHSKIDTHTPNFCTEGPMFRFYIGNFQILLSKVNQTAQLSDSSILTMFKYGLQIYGSRIPVSFFHLKKYDLINTMITKFGYQLPKFPDPHPTLISLISSNQIDLFKKVYLTASASDNKIFPVNQPDYIVQFIIDNDNLELLKWFIGKCSIVPYEEINLEVARIGSQKMVDFLFSDEFIEKNLHLSEFRDNFKNVAYDFNNQYFLDMLEKHKDALPYVEPKENKTKESNEKPNKWPEDKDPIVIVDDDFMDPFF